MYQELDALSVLDLFGIGEDDQPYGVILHGVYNMPYHVQHFRDLLTNARVARNTFNVVIGEYRGKTIWYVPAIGGPLAAFAAHGAGLLGARRMVLIGSFGGTRRGMNVGDLLLATSGGRGDGVSDWYLEPGVTAAIHPELAEVLRQNLQHRGLAWKEGPVFTTPAFMAETMEDILRWESEGYAGVEMETATVYAIAQHFGVPTAALLYLADNLIEERSILDISIEERSLLVERKALLQEIALEIVTG